MTLLEFLIVRFEFTFKPLIPIKIDNWAYTLYNTLRIPKSPNWLPIQIPDYH